MTKKEITLINKLNKISTNYTVYSKEIRYEYHSAALRECLIEAGVDFEIRSSSGLHISLKK